jgi:hypothetical protein
VKALAVSCSVLVTKQGRGGTLSAMFSTATAGLPRSLFENDALLGWQSQVMQDRKWVQQLLKTSTSRGIHVPLGTEQGCWCYS